MNTKIKVLGISGSLRKGSYNTALLRAAQNLAPGIMDIEIYDWTGIPMYNSDLAERGMPEPVIRFREKIAEADALIFAIPEYNFSIPGALKNAIDWVSRGKDQPLNGKPVAIMGATASLWGTIRAQMALRQISIVVNMYPLNKPEILVAQAQTKFDEKGNLIDAQTKDLIRQQLTALERWTRIITAMHAYSSAA